MSISRSVQTILGQHSVFPPNSRVPTNDAEVVERIFYLELHREVTALRALLTKPKTFKKKFIERCKWRATHPEEGIAFNLDPESPTNKLYFQIAIAVCAPRTMKDLLDILMPTVKKHFELDLSFDNNKKIAPVFLRNTNLDKLTQAPTLQALSSLVFINDMVFNTEDIVNFSFQLHDAFNKKLMLEFPALAHQLYEHNHHFKTLSAELTNYNRNGITPREAITELIHGCVLGGSAITHNEYAGVEAQYAYERFFDYLKTLPEDTQEALLSLNYGDFRTYLNNLKNGHCVESCAFGFTRALERHPKPYALLDTPPQMNRLALQVLMNKYGKNGNTLALKKEFTGFANPPSQLSKIIFRKIAPKRNNGWRNFLLNFPNVFYNPIFWQQIKFTTVEDVLITILKNSSRYTDRQKTALLTLIAKNYPRVNKQGSVLNLAVQSQDAEYIQIALNLFSKEQQILEINKGDISGNTALHNAYNNADLFNTLFTIIPNDQRYHAINIKNKAGISVLSQTLHPLNKNMLNKILHLPENDRLAVINKQTLKHFDVKITIEDSYFSEYLDICKCIKRKMEEGHFTFFSKKHAEAKALFNSIINLNDPEAIRAKLLEYIADHSETSLARELLKIMNDSAVAQPRFHLLPS